MSSRKFIDADRITRELGELARFSNSPSLEIQSPEIQSPAVTRVMLSEADIAARDFLCDLFTKAGLDIHTDPAGNIFARWLGSEPDLPAVATGSHTDAIPHSGQFDGTVGVLGGLEAIRALKKSGFAPRRSIELVMFTSEEPTRYGIGCLGSRLMGGALEPNRADELRDADDTTFSVLRERVGFEGSLADVKLHKNHYHAFVELHIEQGPLLERAGLPIGIVTHIAAPAALRVTYEGSGGHAGAVLMTDRRDALLPAAELALFVDRAAREQGGADSVATTGVLNVHPGAVNSIPSRTYLEIDIRDIELARRDAVLTAIRNEAQAIGDRHVQSTSVELINADPPAACDANVIGAITAAADAAELAHQEIISRAYHDSLFMALVGPIGMIFIPCRNGVSHRPDEYASPEAIAAGCEVLAGTLARLTV
jgi:N-carbamoyl-L-amino-acid hydrolase